jgi:hypothetical protein
MIVITLHSGTSEMHQFDDETGAKLWFTKWVKPLLARLWVGGDRPAAITPESAWDKVSDDLSIGPDPEDPRDVATLVEYTNGTVINHSASEAVVVTFTIRGMGVSVEHGDPACMECLARDPCMGCGTPSQTLRDQ